MLENKSRYSSVTLRNRRRSLTFHTLARVRQLILSIMNGHPNYAIPKVIAEKSKLCTISEPRNTNFATICVIM